MSERLDPAWLAAQLDAGRTVAQVALDVGMTPRAVRYAAARHGIELPRHRRQRARLERANDVAWLRHHLEQGTSVADLARHVGLTRAELRHRLNITAPPGRKVDDAAVARLLDAGVSFRAAAPELGVEPSTVRAAAQRIGVTTQQRRAMPRQLRDGRWLSRRYVRDGQTVRQIADELSVSINTATAALRRPGSSADLAARSTPSVFEHW